MSTGYVVFELLAGQAGPLLAAMVAVGVTTWLVTWRWPGARRAAMLAPAAAGADPVLAVRLAWPVQVPRQVDPDARRGHRPRAPSPSSTRTAIA
jgi:hypothetical protein